MIKNSSNDSVINFQQYVFDTLSTAQKFVSYQWADNDNRVTPFGLDFPSRKSETVLVPHNYNCYQGTKRLSPNGNPPFLVIVGQKDTGSGFSEHYIFAGLTKGSLLQRSTTFGTGKNVSQSDFDRFVTLEDILASEFCAAKGHLESAVMEQDKTLFYKIFWEGQNFEYQSVGDSAFLQLALSGKCKSSINEMFEKTASEALNGLKEKWNILSRMDIKQDE